MSIADEIEFYTSFSDGLVVNPGVSGRFGEYGGRYIPESLIPACRDLELNFDNCWNDPQFRSDLYELLTTYAGRPTALTECKQLSKELDLLVMLKREDLTHTGSHKINNVLGQALLAQKMGKTRLIAETGAGQHGVATATAAAVFGMQCTVYMGEVDVKRQELNVFRMKLLGAEVVPVSSGSKTLKDAINEAFRDWVATSEYTHYCVGSVVGPHPYPWMVREFQSIIGNEAREQCRRHLEGYDPDFVVACVGGGSNAAGTFAGYLATESNLVGVEAEGGAAISKGAIGILHGMRTRLMQDEDGQILETHSISAGLDYPGIGPEHSYLSSVGRVTYESVNDEEVLNAFGTLCRTEGIVPALEPAHAIAWVIREAGKKIPTVSAVLITLSGRGDKDVQQVMEILQGKREN